MGGAIFKLSLWEVRQVLKRLGKAGGHTGRTAAGRRPYRQDGGRRLPASLYLAAPYGIWPPMSGRCLCLPAMSLVHALTSMAWDFVKVMFICAGRGFAPGRPPWHLAAHVREVPLPPSHVPCACLGFHGTGLCQCHVYAQAETLHLAALTSMG